MIPCRSGHVVAPSEPYSVAAGPHNYANGRLGVIESVNCDGAGSQESRAAQFAQMGTGNTLTVQPFCCPSDVSVQTVATLRVLIRPKTISELVDELERIQLTCLPFKNSKSASD
jgi:hypothetical protein